MLLRAPHPTLTPGERELIAAYVSGLNDCDFCCSSHAAFAAAQLPAGMPLVDQVRADVGTARSTPGCGHCCTSPPRCAAAAGRSPPNWSRRPARRAPPTWRSTTRC
nr:carboxymuconolactone decarboxylase family protein [Micromonospora aurantiaca]